MKSFYFYVTLLYFCFTALGQNGSDKENQNQESAKCVFNFEVFKVLVGTSCDYSEVMRILSDSFPNTTTPRICEAFKDIRDVHLPNGCVQFVTEIQKLLMEIPQHLSLLLRTTLQHPKSEAVEGQMKQLETSRNDLVSKIENLKTNAQPEFQPLLDELDQVIDEFEEIPNSKLREIQNLQKTLDENSLQLAVCSLKRGNFHQVLKSLEQLKNDSIKFAEIIAKSYDKLTFKNILNFANFLDNQQQSLKILLYQTLYDYMSAAEEDLLSVNILLFEDALKNELRNSQELQDLLAKISENVKNFKKDCSKKVGKNQFANLVDSVSQKFNYSREAWLFNKILGDVITDIYGSSNVNDDETRRNLFRFVESLQWNIHKFTAFSTLAKIVTNNQEKLTLAIKLKNAMETLTGPDPDVPAFDNLVNEFPELIRNIVWKRRCNLRNMYKDYNKEYLYAADDSLAFDSANRRVFTWIPGYHPRQIPWEFQPVPVDSDPIKYDFKLRNVYWGDEYLGSHIRNESQDEYRGYVAASKGGCQPNVHHWELEIENLQRGEILLKHVGTGKYLYGSGFLYDKDRRIPFLYFGKSLPLQRAWKVDC